MKKTILLMTGSSVIVIGAMFLLSNTAPTKVKAKAKVAVCTPAPESYKPFDFPDIPSSGDGPLVLGPAYQIFDFIQTGKSTNGKYLFAKVTVPPNQGPPPHIHHWTDEWFYAPQGGFTMYMGETAYPDLNKIPGENAPKDIVDIVPMRPKELFYGNRFYMHGFINTSGKTQILYIVWTPDTKDVSILPYFVRAGKVLKRNEKPGELTFKENVRFVSLAPEYGFNQSSDFWQYVKSTKEGKPEHMNNDHREQLLGLLKTFSKNPAIKSK
jgi:mannose-6-phosphate isomerase-like protein (cupin superfamily)